MKKKIVILLFLLSISCITSCSKVEIVMDTELDKKGKNAGTSSNSNTYDLDTQVANKAKVEFKEKYNKNSETVTCTVTAPDVYSYMMNNIDTLVELGEEDLYNNVLEYIKKEDCPTRTKEIELPVVYQDDKLIADTSSFEYQDAIHGGMNSAITELYILSIQSLEKSFEQ